MATPTDIDARLYYRVAFQRLDEGKLILEKLEKYNAAIYLTGYAVECILKALLINGAPPRRRPPLIRSYRGHAGHDLLGLREQIAAQGASFPPQVSEELRYVSSWSTDLRYVPGAGDPEDARRFIRAANRIVTWADGRI